MEQSFENNKELSVLGKFQPTKKVFRLYGLCARKDENGNQVEVYLGRHSVEFGRDDIVEVVVVEENS